MTRNLSELFKEIARQASEFDQQVLADLCRMAALEAAHVDIALEWNWDISNYTLKPGSMEARRRDSIPPRKTKSYQVLSRRGKGTYSVLAPNPRAVLAAVAELSGNGHSDIRIQNLDGHEVELEVIQAMVELAGHPTLRLVPR